MDSSTSILAETIARELKERGYNCCSLSAEYDGTISIHSRDHTAHLCIEVHGAYLKIVPIYLWLWRRKRPGPLIIDLTTPDSIAQLIGHLELYVE